MLGIRGPVVIVTHRPVLRLAVLERQYFSSRSIVPVPADSLEITFPNHTSPAIARPSPLQRGY